MAGSTDLDQAAAVLDDPELFATYLALTVDARDVVKAHVDTLVAQLTQIIADGVAQGAFTVAAPRTAARAIFDATTRFRNPNHASPGPSQGLMSSLPRFGLCCCADYARQQALATVQSAR